MLEKIADKLDISVTQYKYLLTTEKTVEKRSLEGKPHVSNILHYVLSFIISATFFFIPFLIDISIFNFALIGMTVSMVMIWMWTFPYCDILIYPLNYPVVAHAPVSSRTYFLVKLTQIVSYTFKLSVCLNVLPAIGGIWIRGEESSPVPFLFPLIYLPIAIIACLWTVVLLTIFAGFLTKLFTFRKLRTIAKFSQSLFPVLFPSIWVIIYFLPDDVSKEASIEIFSNVSKWFSIFPSGWFAAAVSVLLGQIEVRFLILSIAAFISTIFLVLVPLQSIGKTYAKYLSYLLETDTKQKQKLKVKIPRFAKIIRNRVLLAGYCMCSAYLYRDKRMLQSILGVLGGSVGFFIFFTQLDNFSMSWVLKSSIPSLNVAFYFMFCYFGVAFVGSHLSIVRFSEHWKASWIFMLAPHTSTFDLWRSVQITTILYIVFPWTLLQFIVATIFWGMGSILYVLPNVIFLLYFVLFHPKPASGLPFSEEINPKKRMGCMHVIYTHIAMIIYIGILLIASFIDVWVYIVLYCLDVVGGLLGFVYLFTKNRTKIEAKPEGTDFAHPDRVQ